MKILLSAAGTYGDVAPFVAVGVALRERGHKAVLAVNSIFVSMVEQAGLKAYPLEKWRDGLWHTQRSRFAVGPLAGVRTLRQIHIPAMGKRYEELTGLMRNWRPDVVCSHGICLDAIWAAAEMGIPCFRAVVSPVGVLSAEQLSYFPGLLNLTRSPLWLRKFGREALGQVRRWMFDPPVNRVRKKLGLVKQKGAYSGRGYDGQVMLGLWSPFFRPPASDDPKSLRICGFPWFEWSFTGDELEDLLRFLDDGEPPIVFALGTGQFMVAGNFFAIAARVCENLGRRGLFLTGSEKRDIVPDLPSFVRCFPRVPFSVVLVRTSAVVHHGGIGTAAQVMRAGCPSVVVPFAYDQHDNALRIERLGLGVKLSRRRLTETVLSDVLERLLTDTGVGSRCLAMKAKLRLEDGAVEAAKIIEQCA